jgi:hypothetical protein
MWHSILAMPLNRRPGLANNDVGLGILILVTLQGSGECIRKKEVIALNQKVG